MPNILLCPINRAYPGANVQNGSWVLTSTISQQNLVSDDIDEVARTTDAIATSSRFYIDLGKSYYVRAVAILNHNLTTAATIRVKLGNAGAPDANNVFASGQTHDSTILTACPMTFHWTMFTATLAAWNTWGSVYPVIVVLPENVNGRYLAVDISDGNNPAGFIQIGQVFVGDGFQPTINAAYGLKDGHTDLSTSVQSQTGKLFFDKVDIKPRFVDFVVPHLTMTEGEKVHEFTGIAGSSEEVLYVPDSGDRAATQRYGMLGYMRELSPLEYPVYQRRSRIFRITEKR